MDMANKTVLITGAGTGIGRETALGFARRGAKVLAVGRTEGTLVQVKDAAAPGKIEIIVADVGNLADVKRLAGEAERLASPVDILINNAAQYPQQSFLDCDAEEWASVIATNVIGMAFCCRTFLPGMLERGFGRIINIGTFAWTNPIPDSSAYSASKAAVRPFTQAIAREIDRKRYPNVLINELIPGQFVTAMGDRGEHPSKAFPHMEFVASLPAGGPHGETFFGSEILRERPGLRERVVRSLGGMRMMMQKLSPE